MNFKVSTLWQDLCNLIIRPARCFYSPDVNLGPKRFSIDGLRFERTDFELVNPRGLRLQCSHYQPLEKDRPKTRLPCVIYCHGNCGSRCDALETAELLLPYNITVLSFDFAGSGLSEGDFVSLGHYEKQDLSCVVEYLRSTKRVSRVGLWGRSMGAATSLLYSSIDPSIAAVVVDSPFTCLMDVMTELVDGYKAWIPKGLVKVAIKAMRNSIETKANFDIKDIDPLSAASHCFVPALFAHADGDDFIRPHHSEKIFASYMGDKNFIRFPGDHNSERPDFFYDSVAIFFYNLLVQPDSPDVAPPPAVSSPQPKAPMFPPSPSPPDSIAPESTLAADIRDIALVEGFEEKALLEQLADSLKELVPAASLKASCAEQHRSSTSMVEIPDTTRGSGSGSKAPAPSPPTTTTATTNEND